MAHVDEVGLLELQHVLERIGVDVSVHVGGRDGVHGVPAALELVEVGSELVLGHPHRCRDRQVPERQQRAECGLRRLAERELMRLAPDERGDVTPAPVQRLGDLFLGHVGAALGFPPQVGRDGFDDLIRSARCRGGIEVDADGLCSGPMP